MSKKKHEQNARERNKKLQTHQRKLSPKELPMIQEAGHAPEGFRAVPFLDALMAIAEPLREFARAENEQAAERLMSVMMDIWNFTLPGVPAHQKKTCDELIERLCDAYYLDETDAEELLDDIIERKAHLLPDEIQPDDPQIMFLRNEQECQITPIDDARITFQVAALPVTPEDDALLQQLRRLDGMLADGEAFERWETLYFDAERACGERFFEWLNAKGVQEEYANAFPYCIEVFLNFIYRHNAGTLEILQYHELEDFLLHHLARAVEIRPEDYLFWLPAIRFFYHFLGEKGYLNNPQHMIQMMNSIEPEFLAYLKEIF